MIRKVAWALQSGRSSSEFGRRQDSRLLGEIASGDPGANCDAHAPADRKRLSASGSDAPLPGIGVHPESGRSSPRPNGTDPAIADWGALRAARRHICRL